MKKIVLGVLLASSFALAAGVVLAQTHSKPAAQTSDKVCLQYNRLRDWSVVNANTLAFSDKVMKKYKVSLNGNCAHSSFIDSVRFERRGKSGLDCVHEGDRVHLKQRNRPEELCLVSSVSRYTADQRKADEKINPARP